VLLQDRGADIATVAGMMGHTSSKYVMKTYQRYQESNGRAAIQNLPTIDSNEDTKVIIAFAIRFNCSFYEQLRPGTTAGIKPSEPKK